MGGALVVRGVYALLLLLAMEGCDDRLVEVVATGDVEWEVLDLETQDVWQGRFEIRKFVAEGRIREDGIFLQWIDNVGDRRELPVRATICLNSICRGDCDGGLESETWHIRGAGPERELLVDRATCYIDGSLHDIRF